MADMPLGQPKSNAGTWAAVLGGVAVIGGVAAAAFAGAKKPAPKFSGVRRPMKKPCGCGR
jgi:hypothetical protein